MSNSEIAPRSLSCLSYGLYIVSSLSAGRLNGQLVNTVIQVSGHPAKVAVSINKENLTHEFIVNSGVFGVSVLDESAPMTLIGKFGFRSGRDIEKFEGVEHRLGPNGIPLVTEHTLSILEAKVVDAVDVGTHTIFIGELISGEFIREGRAMTYDYYKEHLKGKTPKQAPSYIDS
ncbi:MAG: flavin reductase, partial [Candidatus Coatesbacteria bacterium]|nr:flavin reductase [Candidatus Coatesbacteria bacterium]